MKLLRSLTVKKVIIFQVLLFVAFLLIDFLHDPKGAIDGFKDGYNSVRR